MQLSGAIRSAAPRGSTLAWSGVALAIPASAAAITMAMYSRGPFLVLGLMIGLIVGFALLQQPAVGVAAALLAVPVEASSVQVGRGGLSLTELLMVLAALAALLRIVTGNRVALPLPNALLLGLIPVILIGAINAPAENRALHGALMWGAFGVASLIVATSPLKIVRRILICLVLSGAAVGAVAIANSGNQELVQGGQNAIGRVGVVFDHPNFLAYFMILTLPQAIVLVRLGSPSVRLLALVSIPLMVIGLMLTLSRTGIVGALVALAVLLAWVDFRRVVLALIIVVGAYGVINQGAISRSKEISLVSKRLSTVGGGSSVQRDARPRIWRAVPGIVADHPFVGAGANNFDVVSRRNGLFGEDGDSYAHAHNMLLTIVAELGLIGLAVFLALIAAIGRTAAAGWRRTGPDRPWVISLTASLVGIFVAGLGDYPASNNAIWATTVVVIGALVAFVRADVPAA